MRVFNLLRLSKSAILAVLLFVVMFTSKAEELSPIMGLWRGEWLNPDSSNDYLRINPDIAAEVIGLGNDEYQIRFMAEPFKRAPILFETVGQLSDGSVRFNEGRWRGEITSEGIEGEAFVRGDQPVAFKLVRQELVSPTLGQQPPDGAIILFDGSDMDAWSAMDGSKPLSVIAADGSLQITLRNPGEKGSRNIRSRGDFGDIRMHIEFFIPYMPDRRGQGRGNSGVFLQGIYEVQVLDSFGNDGLWNECGALYKVSPPRVNASFPPGQWQTYDIEFRAARLGSDGEIQAYPQMTVLQNGMPIHTAFELQERTAHALNQRRLLPRVLPGPIMLQEHGSAIRFRNIWVLPLDVH